MIERMDSVPAEYVGNDEGYEFYRLLAHGEEYAQAAVRIVGPAMSLHLKVTKFGPSLMRAMREDVKEMKVKARARGVTMIVGATHDLENALFLKFTRLMGFVDQQTVQAAYLYL